MLRTGAQQGMALKSLFPGSALPAPPPLLRPQHYHQDSRLDDSGVTVPPGVGFPGAGLQPCQPTLLGAEEAQLRVDCLERGAIEELAELVGASGGPPQVPRT